jgi:alpha-galactosidase
VRARHSRVSPLPPGDVTRGVNHLPAPWLHHGGVTLTGAALAAVGIQAPDLYPENLFLLHVAERPGEAG